MYICPLCRQPLQLTDAQLQCASRHSFDLAKEGYVNLLPVQHKNSKDPGDNKQMIVARRAFLQSGAYQPLSDAINTVLAAADPSSILDSGCGEGYYSGRLQQALTPATAMYGIDISKAAVKYAARQYPAIQFAVASAYQLPFADNSFDWVLRVYAPSDSTELQRVVKPQGRLLSVNPGPNHLIEMKQAVYPEVKLHNDAVKEQPGFSHVKRQRLCYTLPIAEPAQLDNLLQMVPLAWKFNSENRQAFVSATRSISIDFLLDVYQLSS
ncbi:MULTISPECIES: 23S rRNA (guanine(745)-N(1))-methyltransferase [unclassified Arsukibacterium]|uniref:23S rRNA (guanine(745)-N(1))-methyltransferase n=1 Tax=unclassified Arsukibacterium TaxID=2635278 RepID=UPI000C937427|nr:MULTISPECIES: 23S rRNA (guanine(745)-N(1))-methyltransferase [unclassified Arsukibacterium]MAA95117.1 23S rRNA (guanine(745)-N(1))-methyltransferase [Rheinheimera sp.]HAW94433.1 23S rRNA (guanine(745)-N(1))-methyltransferase [Candidatus Azambacteria bacterium]|tara:strand:- start:313 stop:1113 length:801 start_codon:yes stop_codon:yes gene_type:complete